MMSWKRTISWLLTILIAFGLGIVVTVVWLRHSAPQTKAVASPPTADLPILALCELLNNPDKYSGQTVRVSAIQSGFIHGMFLYDLNCVTVNTQTAVLFNPANRADIERKLKEARGSDDWREAVDIIATGQFRKVTPSNQSDTIYDTAPLQFEIIRIEKASKVR
jgi:hypothetical protein